MEDAAVEQGAAADPVGALSRARESAVRHRSSPGVIDGDWVEKPLLSREGANVAIHHGGATIAAPGDYGAEGRVYQAYVPIPRFGDDYVTVGSWVIGDEPAGIGLREDASEITRNTSRFVPHYFV